MKLNAASTLAILLVSVYLCYGEDRALLLTIKLTLSTNFTEALANKSSLEYHALSNKLATAVNSSLTDSNRTEFRTLTFSLSKDIRNRTDVLLGAVMYGVNANTSNDDVVMDVRGAVMSAVAMGTFDEANVDKNASVAVQKSSGVSLILHLTTTYTSSLSAVTSDLFTSTSARLEEAVNSALSAGNISSYVAVQLVEFDRSDGSNVTTATLAVVYATPEDVSRDTLENIRLVIETATVLQSVDVNLNVTIVASSLVPLVTDAIKATVATTIKPDYSLNDHLQLLSIVALVIFIFIPLVIIAIRISSNRK